MHASDRAYYENAAMINLVCENIIENSYYKKKLLRKQKKHNKKLIN